MFAVYMKQYGVEEQHIGTWKTKKDAINAIAFLKTLDAYKNSKTKPKFRIEHKLPKRHNEMK